MPTVIGQLATSSLVLVFGILASVAARSTSGAPEPRRSAWRLAAWAFAFSGAIGVVHSLWAVHAFVAGRGSTSWDLFVQWAPTGNHARGVVILVFCLGVVVLATVPGSRSHRTTTIVIAGLPIAALAGAAAALVDGTPSSPPHLLHLATSNLVKLVVLASALLLHLTRDTIDRLLWTCLTLYWLRLAIGTLWITALAWAGRSSTVLPGGVDQFVLAILCYLGMIAIGVAYIRRQRRSVYVPAVLEHLRPLRVKSI